jgi:hypothetical protein
LVNFAVRSASTRTSCATTAKPLPCSPARAASMAAFNASRLVCSAISWMMRTTSPMLSVSLPSVVMSVDAVLTDSLNPVHRLLGLLTTSRPSVALATASLAANDEACSACSATSFTVAFISASEEANISTFVCS